MSTLLHPEGPEPERTYWIRRGIVVAAGIVVVALFAWAISMMFGSGDASTTGTPATSEAPASQPETSTQTDSTSAPAASSSATSGSTAATSTAATSSTPSSPHTSATTPASTSSPASSSAPASSPASSAPATTANPNAPCDPAALVIDVTGPRRVPSGSTMTITTSLAASQGCRLDLTKTPTEIKIYSGTDRIWSTKDCAADTPKAAQQLHPEQGATLTTKWPGKRSRGQCKLSSERLGAGTYVVTVQLQGAKPKQHVFQVT